MNLVDPELELIDPTPNIYDLFHLFDRLFFRSQLTGRVIVRWSKKMYSFVGYFSFVGRGGLPNIALSEPLLKLRPRKDLVETLLHEMIHAYLSITNTDHVREHHGANFRAHMHRINECAGLNISIYHDFHDEVKLYRTHWWRCNGPCQTEKPYFGIVRRTINRAPGPKEKWFEDHKWSCGGTFVKIKEPKKQGKKATSQEINHRNKRKLDNTHIDTPLSKVKKNNNAARTISDPVGIGFKDKQDIKHFNIEVEPSTSKGLVLEKTDQRCQYCDKKVDKTIDEHLDECFAFLDYNFEYNYTRRKCSKSNADRSVIEIDDDDNDIFDETLTMNATETKYPCPCCLEMVEQAEMNEHLDNCLS